MNESQWADLVAECRSSGMSAKLWCEQHSIRYGSYLYWTKKLKKQKWVQVPVQGTVKSDENKCVKLNCGKWTVEVDNETSVQLLRTVLQVVNEVCC